MDTKNADNTERHSLELVLNEFTDEQKELVTKINKLENTITSFQAKMDAFDKKLDNIQVTAPPVSTVPIVTILFQRLEEIKKVVAEQPKNVIQERRLLLFPEHNAREYYSVVLRWFLYMLIATYSFFLLWHIADMGLG